MAVEGRVVPGCDQCGPKPFRENNIYGSGQELKTPRAVAVPWTPEFFTCPSGRKLLGRLPDDIDDQVAWCSGPVERPGFFGLVMKNVCRVEEGMRVNK